jgi:hypothetical protein
MYDHSLMYTMQQIRNSLEAKPGKLSRELLGIEKI